MTMWVADLPMRRTDAKNGIWEAELYLKEGTVQVSLQRQLAAQLGRKLWG